MVSVHENVDAAVEYFEKAIEKKSFKAYLNLASIYKSNKWGRLDNKKAEILLLRAIESSEKEVSAQAAFDLGLLYYFEPSLQINELKALDYLRRAAKQDHVLAMLALGHLSKSESEHHGTKRQAILTTQRRNFLLEVCLKAVGQRKT